MKQHHGVADDPAHRIAQNARRLVPLGQQMPEAAATDTVGGETRLLAGDEGIQVVNCRGSNVISGYNAIHHQHFHTGHPHHSGCIPECRARLYCLFIPGDSESHLRFLHGGPGHFACPDRIVPCNQTS